MKNLVITTLNEYNVKKIKITNDATNSNSINKLVNTIYVINLLDNKIRRNYIILLMKKMKINFHLIVVERINDETYNQIRQNINNKLTKEEMGCCLSHLWCLKDIIKNKD